MPGENCSFYGCSASRRYTGVAFFKVLMKLLDETNSFTKKCVSELIGIITEDRVVDDVHKKLWIY